MEVGGKKWKIKASLHLALGDTPAAACLGGFKEGVGFAKNKCRLCECTDEKMQTCFHPSEFTMQTLPEYFRKCRELQAAKTEVRFKRISADYGINRESHLAGLEDFDITQCLPMDIMHVVQEGAMEYELKCVLREAIIEEKYFTIDQLQDKTMHHFAQFRTDSFDKPNQITRQILQSPDNKLKQSASKMYSLAKAMLFILHDLMRKGNQRCQDLLRLIQDLLEISHFFFAPVVSENRLEEMQQQIEEHLQLFKKLFPDRRVLPKQHYLIHIPQNVSMFGPAANYSTARFESEHRSHKRHIVRQENYKNVAFSIADAAQLQDSMAAESGRDQHPLFLHDLVPGKCSKLPPAKEAKLHRVIQHSYAQSLEAAGPISSIHSTKAARVCGQKYVAQYSFVSHNVEDGHLVFGQVENIFMVKQEGRPEMTQVLFELQPYRTCGFNKALQSYHIQKDPTVYENIYRTVEELIDYKPYDKVLYKRKLYIPLHYEVHGIIQLNTQGHKSEKHNQMYRRGRY